MLKGLKVLQRHLSRRPSGAVAAAAFAGLFGVTGLVWLASSSAATYSASAEAEAATRSGNVSSIGVAEASSNTALKFGNTNAPGILFEDDFNGPAGTRPDQSKWRDYGECADARQAYGYIRCAGEKVMTGQGQLALKATPTLGSSIFTAGKFSFKTGIASAWIKVPSTTGYWPAFWMENRPADLSNVPLYGEVDTLEYYSFAPQYAHGNGIHAWGPNGQIWGGDDNYCTMPGVNNFSNAYHKFSTKFEPTRITSYIDDVQCGRAIEKSSEHSPWPFPPDVDIGHYLILTLAVGGASGQNPTPPNNDQMLVDRVEVRELP